MSNSNICCVFVKRILSIDYLQNQLPTLFGRRNYSMSADDGNPNEFVVSMTNHAIGFYQDRSI